MHSARVLQLGGMCGVLLHVFLVVKDQPDSMTTSIARSLARSSMDSQSKDWQAIHGNIVMKNVTLQACTCLIV